MPEGSKTSTALAPMSATTQWPEVGLTATETGSFNSRWLKLVTTSPSRVSSDSCLGRESFSWPPIRFTKLSFPICKIYNRTLQFAKMLNLVLQFATTRLVPLLPRQSPVTLLPPSTFEFSLDHFCCFVF